MKQKKLSVRVKKNVRVVPKLQTGALLISEPFNPEPTFRRSVILVSQHNTKGTIGFIVNKPTELKVHDALEDFPETDAVVYWGGAVRLDSIYYIHNIPALKGAHKLAEDLYWGGDYKQLKVMIESGEVTTDQIKFLAGYTCWEARQLEKDILADDWWITEGDQYSVLVEEPTVMWGNVLTRMGHVYGILNDFPEDPNLN